MTSISRIGVSALALLLSLLLCQVSVHAQEIFSSVGTTNIDVRYLRGVSPEDAQKVLDFLQSEYQVISKELGLQLKKKLEVRIYDNVNRYLAESNLRKPWRGAYYSHGILHCQPVQALLQREIFQTSLSYELAMAILEGAGDRGCPLWLREAYAVYHSGEYKQYSPPLGAKLSEFSDLNQDIQSYPDPPQREDVHYMLGHTMNYFIQKFGEARAFRLFREFDGNSGVDSVFRRVLGENFATVEKGWAKFISYHTTPFKK
jgi:hypothetical protein